MYRRFELRENRGFEILREKPRRREREKSWNLNLRGRGSVRVWMKTKPFFFNLI